MSDIVSTATIRPVPFAAASAPRRISILPWSSVYLMSAISDSYPR